MAKRTAKPRKKTAPAPGNRETPPGATRKALDRVLEPEGGAPGSGAGPRHAADDTGSDNETVDRSDTTRTPASPPLEREDRLEKGPPYAGPTGGAVGGTPAQLRSSEGPSHDDAELAQTGDALPAPDIVPSKPTGDSMRLTGYEAIEYAEKQGLSLNKHPDSLSGPRIGLTVAEAEAIAEDDADLIWLDVSKDDYYSGPPTDYEPEY